MNKAEEKVLNLIKDNRTYKTKELIRITNFSEVYINKILRSLKAKKYIERIGSNKNGYWNVLN